MPQPRPLLALLLLSTSDAFRVPAHRCSITTMFAGDGDAVARVRRSVRTLTVAAVRPRTRFTWRCSASCSSKRASTAVNPSPEETFMARISGRQNAHPRGPVPRVEGGPPRRLPAEPQGSGVPGEGERARRPDACTGRGRTPFQPEGGSGVALAHRDERAARLCELSQPQRRKAISVRRAHYPRKHSWSLLQSLEPFAAAPRWSGSGWTADECKLRC